MTYGYYIARGDTLFGDTVGFAFFCQREIPITAYYGFFESGQLSLKKITLSTRELTANQRQGAEHCAFGHIEKPQAGSFVVFDTKGGSVLAPGVYVNSDKGLLSLALEGAIPSFYLILGILLAASWKWFSKFFSKIYLRLQLRSLIVRFCRDAEIIIADQSKVSEMRDILKFYDEAFNSMWFVYGDQRKDVNCVVSIIPKIIHGTSDKTYTNTVQQLYKKYALEA
jgi:hypothetical protein